MLPKSKRLTTAQFDQYFKTGKRHHSQSLQVIHATSDTFHGSVVVGKKVYKRAVDRNKLRRQMYAVIYRLMKQQNLTGVWMLVAKPNAKNLPFSILSSEISAVVGTIAKKM